MRIGLAGPFSIEPFLADLVLGNTFTTQPPAGLGGTPLVHLARELLDRGHELTVFTLSPDVSDEVVLAGPQLKVCIGPYRPAKRARDFFRVERSYLETAIRRERPDLVHAHWAYEFALAALAAETPTLVTAHDAPLQVLRYHKREWPYRFIRTLMAYQVSIRSRHLTAVSPYVAEHFRRYLGFSQPIAVIPNGLIPSSFRDTPVRAVPAHHTVTYATVLQGWSARKNGHVALVAFDLVRKQIPGARLVMFGSGHEVDGPGGRWAHERGLTAGVEFAGAVPSATLLQRLASEVDVLVHPALEEACPMAIIEAMALRLPAIAGKASGGVPFVLEHGHTGVLVDVRSATELAHAMIRLGLEPATREALGERAYENARQRFTIQKVADLYLEKYHEISDGL